MKKVLVFLLVLVLVSGLALAACAPATPTPAPKPTTAPAPAPAPVAFKWPEMVNIAGGPAETAGYAAAMAWVSLLQKDVNANIRVAPTEISPSTWRGVQNGQYLMFADAPPSFAGMVTAEGGFATRDGGVWPMRIVWPSSKTVTGFMVRGNSTYNKPSDLKAGLKVGYLGSVPQGKFVMLALLAWANLKESDVEMIPFPDMQSSWDAVPAGKADIAFAAPSAPGVMQAEASPSGIKWIQMDAAADPEGAKRFLAVMPTFAFGVNESGAKSSIGMKGIATISTWLTRDQTDPEMIYQMTKWLGSNYSKYSTLNPYLLNYKIDVVMEAVNTSFVPVHPGLIKYLKEAGKWTAANDTRQAANVALVNKYVDAYAAALKAAEAKGIAIDPKADSDWSKFWAQYKKDQKLPVPACYPGL